MKKTQNTKQEAKRRQNRRQTAHRPTYPTWARVQNRAKFKFDKASCVLIQPSYNQYAATASHGNTVQNRDKFKFDKALRELIQLSQSEHAATTIQTSTKSELTMYYHQSLCLPPKTTLLKAIKNWQLRSFPGLTYELIDKHLPPSTATGKGHMI